MANINDVAKLAGVAPITVSRVINQSGYTSEGTRKKVEEAIAELGYVPNRLARGLRSKRTKTFALVVTDITNPFFTQIARGVEDTASETGYSVIYCNTDESRVEEEKYSRKLIEMQVDGVLLIPAHSNPDSTADFQSRDISVVLLDRKVDGVQSDLVYCDSEDGAYQLIKYLISLGHQQIALVNGPDEVSTANDRKRGYLRALAEAGLVGSQMVYNGAFTQESGYQLTQRALEENRNLTAIFGANNFISIGVMKALRDRKLEVPTDISVVGFDDLPQTMIVDPFLTVASQPAYEMGKIAAGLMVKRVLAEDDEPYQEVVLPVEIYIRKSCGPPKDLQE